jgi:alpha-L-fucosidase
VNGEAIYGTGPTPFGAEAGRFSETEKDGKGRPKFIAAWDWRCTTKPGKIYVHIFKWPDNGKFELPAVKGKVARAYLLADPKQRKLKFKQTDPGVRLSLPDKAPDAIASVVCLETK